MSNDHYYFFIFTNLWWPCYAHSTTSWLDHFICSYDLHVNIFDMQILDKSPSSDHLPVCAKFKLDCIMCDSASCDGAKNNSNIPFTNLQWTKATGVHINKYNIGALDLI